MFRTDSRMRNFGILLGSALIGLVFATSVDAVNPEPVVVQVAFVAPISITETNPLEFGSLDVAMLSGHTVTINPDGTFIESNANVIGGTQDSAKLNTIATPGRPINILVNNVTDGGFYTLATWICDYNGVGTTGPCDVGAGGLSATSAAGTIEVRVGVTLTGLGSATAGDDNGNFDLTVAYE